MRVHARLCFALILTLLIRADAPAATSRVYGLEAVRLERVFDPNPRPERLLLVSGSLKLTGNAPSGNTWEAVTYIPQRTAAPRSDRGFFQLDGNRIQLYSLLTFASYTGQISPDGERLVLTKVSRGGRAQHEVWYLVR